MDLRTNSAYFTLQHYLIGFYNQGRGCLLRGTDWVFKSESYILVLERLKQNLVRFKVITSVTMQKKWLLGRDAEIYQRPRATCYLNFWRRRWPANSQHVPLKPENFYETKQFYIPVGSTLYKNWLPRIMEEPNWNNCEVSIHLKFRIVDMKIFQFYVFLIFNNAWAFSPIYSTFFKENRDVTKYCAQGVGMTIKTDFKPLWRQIYLISHSMFSAQVSVKCNADLQKSAVKTCMWHGGGWLEIWYDRRQRHKGITTEGSRPNTTALRSTPSSSRYEPDATSPIWPRPLQTARDGTDDELEWPGVHKIWGSSGAVLVTKEKAELCCNERYCWQNKYRLSEWHVIRCSAPRV